MNKEEVGHLESQDEHGKTFKGIEVVVEEDAMKSYLRMIWMQMKELPMFFIFLLTMCVGAW